MQPEEVEALGHGLVLLEHGLALVVPLAERLALRQVVVQPGAPDAVDERNEPVGARGHGARETAEPLAREFVSLRHDDQRLDADEDDARGFRHGVGFYLTRGVLTYARMTGDASFRRIATALNEAGIAQAHGLASNVSNRQPVEGGEEVVDHGQRQHQSKSGVLVHVHLTAKGQVWRPGTRRSRRRRRRAG